MVPFLSETLSLDDVDDVYDTITITKELKLDRTVKAKVINISFQQYVGATTLASVPSAIVPESLETAEKKGSRDLLKYCHAEFLSNPCRRSTTVTYTGIACLWLSGSRSSEAIFYQVEMGNGSAKTSPSPTASLDNEPRDTKSTKKESLTQLKSEEKVMGDEEVAFTKEFGFLPIPRHLRYDPSKPPHFGLLLNIAFAFASTFTVANLYYCQPLLIQLSESFNASYSEVSLIPTLVQAGYGIGIVLVSPLGDLLRRRQLILFIVTISTALTIGLAITNNLVVFQVLSFFVGIVSVTPQILTPLAADLAPEKRRASAVSLVLSGLLFGILIARVLAGIIAEFRSWRVVYYFAIGVQALVLGGSYLMLPDYPSKNSDLTYWQTLWTMVKFAVTEPVLIQACLLNLASSACFSNFWVTLTFLLGGPPYDYSTLVIGLFGLVGMAGVAMGPLLGRVLDKLVPWYGTLFAIAMLLVTSAVQTGAGGISVAAVVIAAFGLDVFTQMVRVSLTTSIFGISPAARSRLNAVSILSIFIGQVIGTSVGTHVFVHSGWRAAAALSTGLFGLQLLLLLVRGPHCGRFTWFGYEGGLEARKRVAFAAGGGGGGAQGQGQGGAGAGAGANLGSGGHSAAVPDVEQDASVSERRVSTVILDDMQKEKIEDEKRELNLTVTVTP
uniref:Major facilitator superfamily (MFS) profile domain-containing protein n=1 Tax=Psilocybe cubensis TaxID=181762 RepID=A0A8H8CS17_PSICU